MPWWEEHGYLAGKEVGPGLWVCLAPMIYTWRLMLCTPDWVYGFACYENILDGLIAFNEWDGVGLPRAGYTRTVHLEPRLEGDPSNAR